MNTEAAEIAVTPKERSLLLCLRLTLTLANGVFGVMSIGAVQALPRFEKIIEDMLGSLDKLPMLSQAMITWGRTYPLPLVVVGGIMLAGILMLWLSRWIGAIYASILCAALLAVHTVVVVFACALPLQNMILQLGGGRE